MKYRGLPAPLRAFLWTVLLIGLGAVLGLTGDDALDSAGRWLSDGGESLPWFATRVFGFLAYGMLAASVIYGLLLSTGILDAVAHRVVSFALHQELAALGIALTAVHGAVLTLDGTVATSVSQVLIPFTGSYRPLWVGVGQLAFGLMVVVYGSFFVRRRIGQRAWRYLHYTTFLAYVGATAHGLMAGSDSASVWALATYAGSSALVAFLFAYRLAMAAAQRMGGSSEPARPSVGERA